jgi:hypothetical protein
MSPTDYLLDSALVLLVLFQIKERALTTQSIIRPLIIVGVAVVIYFNGLPTAGNDLVLVGVLGALGLALGTAAGRATFVRLRPSDDTVVARAGLIAAVLWVVGMGLRFAFLVWISHGGQASLAHFSAIHSITSSEAWTDALLAMAVCEVAGRTLVLAARREKARLHRPALAA